MLPAIFNFKDLLRLNKFVKTEPVLDPSFNEVLSETKDEPIPIEAETILEPTDLETEAEVATDIFNKMVEIGIVTEIDLEPSVITETTETEPLIASPIIDPC